MGDGESDFGGEDAASASMAVELSKREVGQEVVNRLARQKWRSETLGPSLAGRARIAALADILFDSGRLRSPIRGVFLEWQSHWRLESAFRKAAFSTSGLSFQECYEDLHPFSPEMLSFNAQFRDFEDEHGPMTPAAFVGEGSPAFKPTYPWAAGLVSVERHMLEARNALFQACVEEWRIIRILARDGYTTLIPPSERLLDRESREVRWIFSADLPSNLLCEFAALEGEAIEAPQTSIASDHRPDGVPKRLHLAQLEKEIAEWFRDKIAHGVDLRPRQKAFAAMREEQEARGWTVRISDRAARRIWDEHAPRDWKVGGAPAVQKPK